MVNIKNERKLKEQRTLTDEQIRKLNVADLVHICRMFSSFQIIINPSGPKDKN